MKYEVSAKFGDRVVTMNFSVEQIKADPYLFDEDKAKIFALSVGEFICGKFASERTYCVHRIE